jgi:hypothetical protein
MAIVAGRRNERHPANGRTHAAIAARWVKGRVRSEWMTYPFDRP